MVSSHFLLALLGAVYCASALHLGIRGELGTSLISKRAHISLQNDKDQNLFYTAVITLGGQPFRVQIDTGSADLWVVGPVTAAIDTGVHLGIEYGIGAVSGETKTTQLEFAGYTVPNQAFLDAAPSSNNPSVPAILGLGPRTGSIILASLGNQPVGDTVLDRIFKQDVSAPNILTVLLGRSNDPAENFPGNITVGEIIPGLESITSQPKLPVTVLPLAVNTDQHWQVLLDENGIIGPDGKPISVQTKIQSTKNPNQLTAIFDTGTALPQVPLAVANAIYSSVPGATLQNVTGIGQIWIVPCNTPIDIAFKFGGKTYPVHPLDTNSDAFTTADGKGCIGAFQPISISDPTYDMILGTSFLRNVYLLLNFGDFIDGSTSATAAPYAQLLSITDPTTANADFTNERLHPRGKRAVAVHDALLHSGSRPLGGNFMKEKIPIIIVSSIGVGLVLLGALLACCTGNRFSKSGQGSLANTYQRLEVPAPRGDFSQVHGYHTTIVPIHASSWGGRR